MHVWRNKSCLMRESEGNISTVGARNAVCYVFVPWTDTCTLDGCYCTPNGCIPFLIRKESPYDFSSVVYDGDLLNIEFCSQKAVIFTGVRKTALSVQRLATSWSPGIESRWRRIFRTRPDRPWGPPSLLYKGYLVSVPEIEQWGRGVNHPPHLVLRLKK